MRENMTKREGLALGKYRHPVLATTLPTDIKWVSEKDFATGLGVPIGNDFDAEKWWKKKLDALRDKTKRWGGLYRSSYFGRNLIVQAMYYGSLRYWLYSLPMSPDVANRIHTEANILLWSKEPNLDLIPKRYRRLVAALTAIGPIGKGGLNTLDWHEHVRAFQAEWIIKYLHHHKQPHIIPMKHRNKKLLTQDDIGNYEIHDAIWKIASDLGLQSASL
jgi:hypothetical protein